MSIPFADAAYYSWRLKKKKKKKKYNKSTIWDFLKNVKNVEKWDFFIK